MIYLFQRIYLFHRISKHGKWIAVEFKTGWCKSLNSFIFFQDHAQWSKNSLSWAILDILPCISMFEQNLSNTLMTSNTAKHMTEYMTCCNLMSYLNHQLFPDFLQ